MTFLKLFLFTWLLPVLAHAQWERGILVESARENIFNYDVSEYQKKVMAGRRHALIYPISSTNLMIPYEPLKDLLEAKADDPVRVLIFKMAKVVSPFKSMNQMYGWLGLHKFPEHVQRENPNTLPELSVHEKALPMGATLMETNNGVGLTFGCAACHSSDLFGVKVLGLTNRFPRANDFFHEGKKLAPYVNSFMFRNLLNATEGERLMVVESKDAIRYVGTKKPQVLGLDTSLAQVALSLSRREQDALATKSKNSYKNPRPNKLSTMIADSKPAVWWNAKYKNRWLSDGSIVSGNPVHTNFLWNEIGRGADLTELEAWLKDNDETIKELTAAVFASKPPRYENFFGVHSIDISKAQRGQKIYAQSCARCHGTYEKGWEQTNSEALSSEQKIQNIKLTYHKTTPVRNVGTDPGRFLGMREFSDALNNLKISKSIGTVVEPQNGYVPPPLDGIWSRWPYFHNNSVPSLCALLTKSSDRPKTYFAGPAKDKNLDFDQECNGYPLGNKTPQNWKKNKDFFYDTAKEGLSNKGHDEGIFLRNGAEILTVTEKKELIEFLKTL